MTKKCVLCGEILDGNRKKYCDYCRSITKKMSIESIISQAKTIINHTAGVKPSDSDNKVR